MLEVGLFWIGVLLVVVAIVMLFLDSFQSRKVWAVISLVLLFPLLIHMVLHWSSLNVRKSLYILIIGMLTVLVSVSGGALSKLSFLQDHEVVQALEDKIAPPEDVPLSNQKQADSAALSADEGYDPLLTGSEYEKLEINEIVPEKPNQVVRKAEPSARYDLVADNERIYALNKHVRIIMADGTVVEGKLTEIDDDSVIVEAEVNGGSLGLSYKNDQMQSMAVRLVEGEKLVPQVLEEESAEQSAIDQPEPGKDVLQNNINMPLIEDTSQIDTSSVPTGVEQPTLEASESLEPAQEIVSASEVQTEALEKIEEIVDDTKLLDNVNGQ